MPQAEGGASCLQWCLVNLVMLIKQCADGVTPILGTTRKAHAVPHILNEDHHGVLVIVLEDVPQHMLQWASTHQPAGLWNICLIRPGTMKVHALPNDSENWLQMSLSLEGLHRCHNTAPPQPGTEQVELLRGVTPDMRHSRVSTSSLYADHWQTPPQHAHSYSAHGPCP